ncbi:MAG: hypothetical protein Ct9H300mP1_09130 [Planctomycetaceae bacterium]|nr:MAG: hypothetical protein Ct9H300mP1_09130 [Planctomycetaceae bacterium]
MERTFRSRTQPGGVVDSGGGIGLGSGADRLAAMHSPGAGQSHSTDFSGVQQVDGFTKMATAALLKPTLDHAAGRAGRFDHRPRLLDGARYRGLDEDVHAGQAGLLGHRCVMVIGGGDHHRVEVALDRSRGGSPRGIRGQSPGPQRGEARRLPGRKDRRHRAPGRRCHFGRRAAWRGRAHVGGCRSQRSRFARWVMPMFCPMKGQRLRPRQLRPPRRSWRCGRGILGDSGRHDQSGPAVSIRWT